MGVDKPVAKPADGAASAAAATPASSTDDTIAKSRRKTRAFEGERKSVRQRGKISRVDPTTAEKKGRKKQPTKPGAIDATAEAETDTKSDAAPAAAAAAASGESGAAAAAVSPKGGSKKRSKSREKSPAATKRGKRSAAAAAAGTDSKDAAPRPYDVVLCDIEGTTTPISFVKNVLFPYIEKNVDSYLQSHWDEAETKADVAALIELAAADVKAGTKNVVPIPSAAAAADGGDAKDVHAAVVRNVAWQMSENRKSTALKQLQGHMWRAAYAAGEVAGQLYADVLPNWERWIAAGAKIAIYSSGSIEAQKLLFRYTDVKAKPDLTPLLSGYFDTTTGPKTESESYRKIAAALGVDTKRVLFLTDLHLEAVAATAAGLGVVVMLRSENAPLPVDHTHLTADDFDGVHSHIALVASVQPK